jgi:TyrR family helix-turn-helix protein
MEGTQVNNLKEITPKRFEELYYKHTYRELQELLGVSKTTIANRLKEYEIPKKGWSSNGREKKALFERE